MSDYGLQKLWEANQPEEKRIYVVLPKTVDVVTVDYSFVYGKLMETKVPKTIEQIPGRNIAQACHVVSKLRLDMIVKAFQSFDNALEAFKMLRDLVTFTPITTIILECRNSKELTHIFTALTGENKQPTLFQDENPAVYGNTKPITALAVYALPSEVDNTLGYLPLWGAK